MCVCTEGFYAVHRVHAMECRIIVYRFVHALFCYRPMLRDSRKSRKHGNHGNRDFRQMPWFCQNTVFAVFFGQNAVFLRFYNNILFLISVSWSLLCDFNTKMFYICLCNQSQCALWPWCHHRNMYFTFSGLELVNAPQWQNFTVKNLALHVMMVDIARCWIL